MLSSALGWKWPGSCSRLPATITLARLERITVGAEWPQSLMNGRIRAPSLLRTSCQDSSHPTFPLLIFGWQSHKTKMSNCHELPNQGIWYLAGPQASDSDFEPPWPYLYVQTLKTLHIGSVPPPPLNLCHLILYPCSFIKTNHNKPPKLRNQPNNINKNQMKPPFEKETPNIILTSHSRGS